MGIKAISLTAQERYVSTFDSGHNAITVNLEQIKKHRNDRSSSKGKEPEPVYAHASDATVFILGTMTSLQLASLKDDLTSFQDAGLVMRSADNDVMAARLAILGFENFEIEYERETVIIGGKSYDAMSSEVTEQIPFEVLREIGQHVKSRNSFSAVEEKNSDSGSSPSNSSKSETAEPVDSTPKSAGDATPAPQTKETTTES